MPDGACDYFSTQWTQHTGVPERDLLGWRWLAVLHPDDREPTRRLWTDSVAGRGPYDVEYRVCRSDGVYPGLRFPAGVAAAFTLNIPTAFRQWQADFAAAALQSNAKVISGAAETCLNSRSLVRTMAANKNMPDDAGSERAT